MKISIVAIVKQIVLCLAISGFLYGTTNDPRKETTKETNPSKKIESSTNAKKNPPPVAKTVVLEKLIDTLQKHYESTKSATFNFEQSYKHPFLSLTETSKGTVSYKRSSDGQNKAAVAKPRVGKMLWSYTEPKDKQKKFYIDGNKLTYYSARDNTAFRHECYDQDTLSVSVAFLLGDGNLKAAFTITPLDIESPNPSLTWLTLTPKENNSPVKKLYLGLNKQAQVMESLVEDPSGGKNHFKFFAYKMNPVILDSMFVFTPPRGVIVQPAPNVVCDAPAKNPSKNVAPSTKPAPKEPSPKPTPAKKIPKAEVKP